MNKKKHQNINGLEMMTAIYGTPKKKRKKRIEKVKKLDHWRKEFQPKHQPNE